MKCSPLLTPRLTSLADDFDEYRFTQLRYRIHASAIAAGNYLAVCFEPGVQDSAPASVGDVSEANNAVILGTSSTVCSNWSSVPKGVLSGMHPWYKTVAGTPESAEEVQGNLYAFCSTGTGVVIPVEVQGVVEFRAAICTSATPLDRALAQRRREKQRIVNLLATADMPPTARVVK